MTFRTLPDTDQLPHALYTAEQVRGFDRMAIERFGIPGLTLMERAGQAAFDLIRYARSWRREIVEGQGKRGDVVWLPVAWTDAGPEDPFLVMSKGRSWFRVEDLVRLVALIEEVRS